MLFEGLVNYECTSTTTNIIIHSSVLLKAILSYLFLNNTIRFLMVHAEASYFVLNDRTSSYVEYHIIFKSTGVSPKMTM